MVRKQTLRLVVRLIFVLLLAFFLVGCEKEQEVIEPSLSFGDTQALHLAINDEYKSLTISDFSIAFGTPFTQLLAQKSANVEALSTLFQRNLISVPENPWTIDDFELSSKQDACEAALLAEAATLERYQNVRSRISDAGLQTTFSSLESISQQMVVLLRDC